jgi:hypothetical protein
VNLKARNKILLTLYKSQLNRPDVKLDRKRLGLDFETFCIAIEQLLDEGLICNANVIRLGMCHRPVEVFTGSIKLTNRGVDYVKANLESTADAVE